MDDWEDDEVWLICSGCGIEQPDMGPDICCECCGGGLERPPPSGTEEQNQRAGGA